MLRFEIFVVALITSLVGASQLDFKLDNKWVTVIEHKLWTETTKWTLTADSGSKIKIFCTDFRTRHGSTEEQTCNLGKMVLNDGISTSTYCGSQHDLYVVGNSSSLVVDFITNESGGGFLECIAKAVQEPKSYEVVEIKKKGTQEISFPEVRGNENDKAWRLKSIAGTKLLLQCRRRMQGPLNGVCVRDILTVDAGNGPTVSCGYDPVTVTSEGSEITMRVETFPETDGHVDCIVHSLNPDGSVPSGTEELEPPQESDEHGVSPGPKSTTCPCGKANRDSGRIINGTEVKNESKYPFMVSLRWPGGGHFCGASIITPIHILTAAHCVSDRWTKDRTAPEDVVPVVGAHNTWKDASHGETQTLKVKAIHIADGWFAVKGSLADDIAIIELEKPIRYSKWVGPVCLTPTLPDVVKKYIKMMGWGRTEEGTPDILREANALVLSPRDCNNNVKEVCFRNGPSASCFGDSGGPYVHVDPETNRYTQIGLVSYGYGVCNGRFYVGTNTAHWYDWIQKTVAATSGGHGICQKVD